MTFEKFLNNHINPGGDDTLECLIFPVSPELVSTVDLCDRINCTIKNLAGDYIWHKDEFQVHLSLDLDYNKDYPVHLRSTTCFGDNIEDEWFIVYIAVQLTKHEDIIVQLRDSDGDFLLIEAADFLPSWANPDNTYNRVFVYKGHINLISPDLAALDDELTIKEALKLIVDHTVQTQASTEIQKSILDRVGNYPDKIDESTHTAVVNLPVDIAALFTLYPNLIAPIVTAYCARDVLDEKLCKNVSFDKAISTRIRFTKCLYAMILHSPLIKRLKVLTDKRNCLGLKLCYGYQIIMNSASTDMYAMKEYQKFIANLKKNGYFNNNIEGSKEYQKLLKQADQYFTSTECPIKTSVSSKITEIIQSDEYVNIVEQLQNKSLTEQELQEDNEDWLKIKPEQLNDMLNSRYGKKSKFKNDDAITPQNITAELNDFLKKSSDYEGIESLNHEPSDTDKIEFDSDQFANCIEKMLNLIIHNEKNSSDDDFGNDSIDSDDISDNNSDMDGELKEKLYGHEDSLVNNRKIHENIVKSMREEKAYAGPSSNLLTSIGLRKTDFIDSDDD